MRKNRLTLNGNTVLVIPDTNRMKGLPLEVGQEIEVLGVKCLIVRTLHGAFDSEYQLEPVAEREQRDLLTQGLLHGQGAICPHEVIVKKTGFPGCYCMKCQERVDT